MPKLRRHPEIEIKLRVPDLRSLRERLRQLRAREIAPRTHESNTLYDTPRKDLKRRGQLLRLRVHPSAAKPGKSRGGLNETAILTHKAPFHSHSQPETRKRLAGKRERFKIREEAEVSVANAYQVNRILRGLGLEPVFRYEKFRTTYTLPGVPKLMVELDETPIGNYVELEGPTAGIDRGARLLGYAPSEYIKQTYGWLYLAECRRRGVKPGDMTFQAAKKWRRSALFP